MTTLRLERREDEPAIHALLCACFPSEAEARLVGLLRRARRLSVALVATVDGKVVGYIAISPVSTANGKFGAGVAPLAVHESHRGQGIAGSLVRGALEASKTAGLGWAVVLGEPAFYGRFGFQPAPNFGLLDEYGGGNAFQVLELVPGTLPRGAGVVQYAPEFASLG